MSTYHSIAVSGMALFERPIQSFIGSIRIDLASAPLDPGPHRLEIDSGVGSIGIYLPRYVPFTVEGGPALGGQDIHDGLGTWAKLARQTRSVFRMSNQLPDEAIPDPHPDQPTTIHFVITSAVGGLDIYRI